MDCSECIELRKQLDDFKDENAELKIQLKKFTDKGSVSLVS